MLILLVLFGDALGGDEADTVQFHQLPQDCIFQGILGQPVSLHELASVLAAAYHLLIEDIGIDVGVMLEDIIEVDEDKRTGLLLLFESGEHLVGVERLEFLDHFHAVLLLDPFELRLGGAEVGRKLLLERDLAYA